MKVSMNWLKEYVDIGNDYKLLENKFNLMSQEVESLYKLVDIDNLVVGKVLTCEKHPEADKLHITTVDIKTEVLQIICGAPNIAKDQMVIVAPVGTVLPGDFKIKKAKIRGVESSGMICSLEELGVKEFDALETGIYVLGENAEIGEDPLVYLGLNDHVLELDLTANRPDLLSMEGVGYDAACMLGKEINLKKHKYEISKEENDLKVFTETKDCNAYYGQVINNVKIKQSPYWMRSRLLAAGVRPINNVVDITNYVMMEYGQPLHAFDYDKVATDTILVRHAKKGEILLTLDDQERELLETDLVITDGEKPIALAGVMGGLDTEVDGQTTRILLESASFSPLLVRKTSRRLDLRSESSARFEKGIDPNKIKKAMDYATQLFIELADGEVVGEYSFFDNTNKTPHVVDLSLSKLNLVTGNGFDIATVKDVLKRLDFKYHLKGETFHVEVPTRRQSVYGYQDIIEEIVRIHGYDKIPTNIPETPTFGHLTKIQKMRRVVRNHFVNIGFNETISYSLVGKAQATEFDSEELPVIEIMNPLNKEKAYLRHSLIPSLIDILNYNKARKTNDVFLFEIGRSYLPENEKEKLSGLMTGVLESNLWQGKSETTDFYLLKGIIESLLETLNIVDYSIVKSVNPVKPMHPGISADVHVNGEYLGYIGRLHPQKEYEQGINPTYVFELDFEKLSDAYYLDLIMAPIPKFPSVSRDLALVLDRNITAKEVIEKVKEAGKKSLIDLRIFDVYKGDKIASDKMSIALSLTLQNPDKTLETKEVDTIIDRIIKHLNKTLGAELR